MDRRRCNKRLRRKKLARVDYFLQQAKTNPASKEWILHLSNSPPSIKNCIHTFERYHKANMDIVDWRPEWVLLSCLYMQCYTQGLSKEEIDDGLRRISDKTNTRACNKLG